VLVWPGSAKGAVNVPVFDHIFVIVFENHAYSQIVGNPAQAPYFNRLAARYGVATNYRAVTHPSLPNYLALVGGSTFGVTTNCTTCFVAAENLVADRIVGSGSTWKAYMENLPAPCFVGDAYPYAQRHNPFIYFDDIRTTAQCNNIVPLTSLTADLGSVPSTPDYVWITPNLCNDMHDCSIATGDTWLSNTDQQILHSAAFTSQSSLLVVTFDEDDASQNNQVATLLIAHSVAPGFRSATAYNHYSLLRTIGQSWGLAPLTTNDGNATAMTDFFQPASVVLNAVADTYTARSAPTSTAGGFNRTLRADIAGTDTAFMRFDLRSLSGSTLKSAALRLHASTESWAGSAATFDLNLVGAVDWKEQWMSYTNTVPISPIRLGVMVAPRTPNTWYQLPLDPAALQPKVGSLTSMALRARSGDVFIFNAREAGPDLAPQLQLTLN
jgi:hypothetical protein